MTRKNQDDDSEKNEHYLVAESFDFSTLEVRILQKHQMSGALAEYLTSLLKNHHDSILKKIACCDTSKIDALIKKIPAFNEKNVAYQIYSRKNSHRVLVIYNTRRMVDFVEKRQLNPNESGEDGLLHKNETLAFHVNPLATEPWKVRLQGSSARNL